MPGNVCNEFVGFRVEARDTVIAFKQGSKISNPFYDTLYFSTFSIMNAAQLTMSKPHITNENNEYLRSSHAGQGNQWVDCSTNSLINSAVSQKFSPNKAGSYSVLFTNQSCTDSSSCIFIDTLNRGVIQVNNSQLRSEQAAVKYQWIDCRADTIIPGANSRLFNVIDTGYYAVVISKFSISDTSACIPVLSIGIKEIDYANEIEISGKNLLVISFFIGFLSTTKTISQIKKY